MQQHPQVAVVLSGCGVFDGSEIYESVLTLFNIEQAGASYQCFAPNTEQAHVINHLTGQVMENEKRNVLIEAARLARGDIKDIADADPEQFDAVIFPGGFGAAKNLTDFAFNGSSCQVNNDVRDFAKRMHESGKPVGFICIAPVMAPLIIGQDVKCTIGNDKDTAAAITAMGGQHFNCPVSDVIVDAEKKVVTTPAYMLAGSISEAATGIKRLVQEVLALVS